ncbi:MAG: hypothetical protein R3Y63_10010 [Eubacteriales bacterium]
MKKIICSLLLCSCCLSGCSSETTDEIQSAEDHIPTTSEMPQVGEYYNYQNTVKDFPSLDGIPVDFDFTQMSGTVSYSMAMMMMYEPEDYWDKSFRINGTYLNQYIEEFGELHILLLMDETNCCQGFIEFTYPEGYAHPENGDVVGVIGEYILVDDPEYPYSVLDVSQIAF